VAALNGAADGKAVRNVFPGSRFDAAAALNGSVDLTSLTVIGHSFGGATAVAAVVGRCRLTQS
jgi:hypothetical protein